MIIQVSKPTPYLENKYLREGYAMIVTLEKGVKIVRFVSQNGKH